MSSLGVSWRCRFYKAIALGVILLNVGCIDVFVKDRQLFREGLRSYRSHTMPASVMTTALNSTVGGKRMKQAI